MPTVTRWMLVTLLFTLACTSHPAAPAQPDKAGSTRVAKIPGIVRVESSTWVDVFSSPHGEVRARELRDLVDGTVTHWSTQLGGGVHFVLAVLDEHDWKAVTDDPYGFPHGDRGDPWIIFMPAVPEKSVIVATTSPLVGNARALAMLDNIAAHEVGHIIAVERIYGRDPQPALRWFNELVATYLAYGYLRAAHPERATIWDEVTVLALAAPRPAHTSLDDFEHGRFEMPAGYNWYELAFSGQAKAVYDRQGDRAMLEIKAKLPWAQQGSWTSPQLLGLLEPITPGFQAWALSLEAPAD